MQYRVDLPDITVNMIDPSLQRPSMQYWVDLPDITVDMIDPSLQKHFYAIPEGSTLSDCGNLVSWCFEPSQPLGIISGPIRCFFLHELFHAVQVGGTQHKRGDDRSRLQVPFHAVSGRPTRRECGDHLP